MAAQQQDEEKQLGADPSQVSAGSDIHDALTPEHKAFLIQRHGTIDLDPVPSMEADDPYNWPSWKKNINILLISMQSMLGVFNAIGVVPALPILAERMAVSVGKCTYIVAVEVLFLGIAPLFWKPIANRYGRRPIWIYSQLASVVVNVACVFTSTYGLMLFLRILAASFNSPSLGLGGAVVSETFFVHQRASRLGWWTLFFTLGPSLGPLLVGIFVNRTGGYEWVFWFFAILSVLSFLAAIFLNPETLPSVASSTTKPGSSPPKSRYALIPHRLSPAPFHLTELTTPFLALSRPTVVFPAIGYAMSFCVANTALLIEIPIAYAERFSLNEEQVGYNFIAVLIGASLGEFTALRLSRLAMKPSGDVMAKPREEKRLWVAYLGIAAVIAGTLEFGVTLQHADFGRWSVLPDVGLGIASFGLQIVANVLVTYAISSNADQPAAVGTVINVIRQIWGFIGPFWFNPMYENLGYEGATGLLAGLVFLLSVVPTIGIHVWRSRRLKTTELPAQVT